MAYFSDQEVERRRLTLADKDLRRALDEVNSIPGENWFIESYPVHVRRWFRKPMLEQRFYLYSDVGSGEWQVINFAPASGDWSINHLVRKCDILILVCGAKWTAPATVGRL